MTVRAIVIPRVRKSPEDWPHTCAVLRDDYRCVLDITRVVESWNERLGVWTPEIRLCHLHAIEYVTGNPVYLPSFAQQQIDMVDLGA